MIDVGRRLVARVAVVLVTGIALVAPAQVTPARAETASAFMQRAANDLLAANRAQSPALFGSALRRYGDVPGIGLTALGDYAGALPKTDRPLYYNGIVNFISRYAANESGRYAVAKAVVLGQSDETATGAAVETRVELKNGDTYDVRWQLVRYGGSYKIRDAQVLGFWMTPFLGDLFQKYIAENGGSSKALILALNRYGGSTAEASTR
jgi:phospholipid transport system substrate-binding protein